MSDKKNASTAIELNVANKKDLDSVLKLVREYHDFEGISGKASSLMNAVYPLLKKNNEQGRILLIENDGKSIGFIALCFGYSLEFGGRDAFIDELFLRERFRGQRIGEQALEGCQKIAKELGVKALHIESNTKENKLTDFYTKCGFKSRDKYRLMTLSL